MDAASICGSDLHGLAVPPGQYMKPGIIYGHEFCGTIVQMGDAVQGFSIGERVAVNPRVRCGTCYECTHNKAICAPILIITAKRGWRVCAICVGRRQPAVSRRSSIPPEVLAQTEPLACVMNAIGQAHPSPVDSVLLYGAGPIGLTFIRVLKLFGIRHLIVTAKGAQRVQEAKACGADVVVDTETEQVEQIMRAHWPYGADLVIDAVGRGPILSEALPLMNPKGRLVLFGLDNNARTTLSPAIFTLNELSVFGVLGKDFPSALEMLQSPDLHLEKFITHRLSLEDIHQGRMPCAKKRRACDYFSKRTISFLLSSSHSIFSEHPGMWKNPMPGFACL